MSQGESAVTGDLEPSARQEMKREIIEFGKMILWFLVLFFVVKTYVMEGYEVQGPSMIPTLVDRERILVFKLPHTLSQHWPFRSIEALKPGDIVVFDSPSEKDKRYVKRVIARGPNGSGSNTVQASGSGVPESSTAVRIDEGQIYVNNRRVDETYLPKVQPMADESFSEMRVPPENYYVMGDNRGVSKDSRSFGPVADEHVVGRAVLCFWPPSKIRWLK